jgi:hypothetical protein
MRVILAAALSLIVFGAAPAVAGPQSSNVWRITKDHWSQADEEGFGRFVTAIGDSGCTSSESCLRSRANPWAANEDRAFLDIDVDCAKLPYLLRAYYAWKNGLPFTYADGTSGGRFSKNGNRVTSRQDIVDHGGGIDGARAIRAMLENVYSGTFRIDAMSTEGMPSDFYSPALQPGSIRPGTVIYDPNGHVGIVYRVDGSGRVYYMDAHPDFAISRSVYGAQFGQGQAALGGGLKNWRPFTLVGARREAGVLVGGHMKMTRQRDIPDYSLVQYLGTEPNPSGDVRNARFTYNGAALGYYEYARVAISGGKTDFNPVYELQATMRTLCNDLEDRRQAVDQAVQAGLAAQNHPGRIPANIYLSDDGDWESYATPARDARMRAAFVAFRRDLGNMIQLWVKRDPRIVYDGLFLKQDLLKTYDAESKRCTTVFLSSDKRPVALSFDDVTHRLFAMSFDPYNCVELRWGADSPACPDQAAKRGWYQREQQARNEIGRDEPGSAVGLAGPADVDIRGLLVSMPDRVPFVQRFPGD